MRAARDPDESPAIRRLALRIGCLRVAHSGGARWLRAPCGTGGSGCRVGLPGRAAGSGCRVPGLLGSGCQISALVTVTTPASYITHVGPTQPDGCDAVMPLPGELPFSRGDRVSRLGCVGPKPHLSGLVCPKPQTAALIAWGAWAPSPIYRGLCAPSPKRPRRPGRARRVGRVSRVVGCVTCSWRRLREAARDHKNGAHIRRGGR
jgi:hypothetical protein